MMEKPIGIIGAMEMEVSTLVEQMDSLQEQTLFGLRFYTGLLHGTPAVVVQCGIGKVNAARCAQLLTDRFEPKALINTGCGGGIAPGLKQGDIVIATALCQHDFYVEGYAPGNICERGKEGPSWVYTDARVSQALSKAAETFLSPRSIHSAAVVSGDQFICKAEDRKRLYEGFSASVTEMEGAAIAQVAAMCALPFGVIRSISDLADGSAPQSFDVFAPAACALSARVVLEAVKAL